MSLNPDTPRPASRGHVALVLAATTLAQVASVLGIAAFPVIAPRLALDMGVPTSYIGYQMSIIYGTAMVGAPMLSHLVTRLGPCRTSQLGLGFCVVAMMLALLSNLWAIAAASVFLGLAMSVMVPAATHLLFRFSPPQHRNFIFSFKQTGVPMAWTIMALCAPVITVALGWRWALALVLVIAFATLAGLQPMRQRWDDDRKPGGGGTGRRLMEGLRLSWEYPVLRWLGIASLFLTFVQLCLGSFVVVMMVEEFHYSLVTAGLMLSVVQAAGVAGRILWGWIADRIGDSLRVLQWVGTTTFLCCIVTVFLSPAWPVWAISMFFFVFGSTAVGWNGLFVAEVARNSPKGQISAATSGAMSWNFAGILVGPALFATAYKFIGSYAWTYAGLAIIAGIGLVLLRMTAAAARRDNS